MLDAKENEVIRLRGEAHNLATKLNGGTSMGICASDGYGKRLEAETATTDGFPKWGQAGSFIAEYDGIAVRIEMDGMFGIGSTYNLWPGFSAHAVDRRKPFLSDTGYRSFTGCGFSRLVAGQTPDQFVALILTDYVNNQLGGKLRKIKPLKPQAAA